MELYGRFMVTLAFGLLGLGIVLQVLLDQVFNEWDVVADAQVGFRRLLKGGFHAHRRTEDILLDIEKDKPMELTTRLSNTDRKGAPRSGAAGSGIVEHKAPAPGTAPVPALTPIVARTGASSRNPVYDDDWG